jgi:NAD(P)-dependent dehydrogenase (short-subunit alcohol dehydrogenase family)
MKYMITGGNAGLGLALCQRFDGQSYSRSNGYDIGRDSARLAEISLAYDVVINNAYDGVLGQSWHDVGQTRLLHEIAMTWQASKKTGHIINIGGVGSEDGGAPFPGWESYNSNKRALKHMSLQWTQAFRSGQVLFRTSLLTVDRLDKANNGDGHDLDNIADMIELCLNVRANTCVGEIKAWVNLDHKQ